MSDHNDNTSLYPEPTIVVGVGRFGLSVVERLGADWRWLKASAGEDRSIKNLRLLSVRPDREVDERQWRRSEHQLAEVARAAGEDDLPTLAVHWAIVRSLGLVRYRNGTYQFALPRDAGVVEKGDRHNTRRLRYFEWRPLDSDPVRAVQRLHQLADDDPEVDLFLTPIVQRVFHGQSPRLLLHLIGRCRALLQGRDPSPWPWIEPQLPGRQQVDQQQRVAAVEPQDQWLTEDDRAGFLDGIVGWPLSRWPTVGDDERCDDDRVAARPERGVDPMRVPRPFWPSDGDLATPLSPRRFLRVDWERSGWVTDELANSDSVEFTPVDASLYRLGFFDHDATGGVEDSSLEEALQRLGQQVHRGLLRIWLDLRCEREETEQIDASDRKRTGAERAVEQCLEILGELVVAPVLGGEELPQPPQRRHDQWVDGPELAREPSTKLRETVVDVETPESMPRRPLLERFAELGLHFDTDELGSRPLFRDLTLEPDQVDEGRLTPFRRLVNTETRHLVSFDHLKEYRQSPTRKPPRLSVYVVADMREPFVRRAIRPVLRALHQELMRAYGPLFDTSRQGFDRPLSIVPIVWTPHPADAFGGDYPEANRVEEASMLNAVHELRRWVEALPVSRRAIPQIFLNSRVTDKSVLGVDDAIAQTRDFLSLQLRNDLARDSWLRETAVGLETDDLFSTFSCVQVDFPAERAREYLANRLGREALIRLRESGRGTEAAGTMDVIGIDGLPDDLLEPPKRQLSKLTADTARRLDSEVQDRIVVDASTTSTEIVEAMSEGFEEQLFDRVHDAWMELSRNRGAMDGMVDQLRGDAADHLVASLKQRRNEADRLIEREAAKGGLKNARTAFRRLHEESRQILDDAEDDRRRCQELCLSHDIPDPTPIGGAREQVVQAAQKKPDQLPLRVGMVAWAIMAPVLGAPLVHSLARAFDLHHTGGPLELVLGPGAPVVGAIVLFVPVFVLLRRHLREAVNDVHDAIGGLADTVRDVVEGAPHGMFDGRPSIRSFFAARLRMTAALAGRNYADHIHDRVSCDNELANRLYRSIETQQRRLRHRAETLGVRPASVGDQQQRVDDDVTAIFDTDDVSRDRRLLSPQRLVEYYRRHFPDGQEVDRALPKLLERAGGFSRWRREACLSDTEALLDYGRDEFSDIVTVPVGAHTAFEEEVGNHLVEFVARHYANVGFGAQFIGYEGFDADGLRRVADTSLVVHPLLRTAFDKVVRDSEERPTTEGLDVIEAQVLPNTAFMLSLVQGIHARSIENLRRHETFYDRLELPDPATPWDDEPLTLVGRRTLLSGSGEAPDREATGESDETVSKTQESTPEHEPVGAADGEADPEGGEER